MNFKKNTLMDKLPDVLKMEVGTKKTKKPSTKKIFNFITMDFNIPLDKIEKGMLRSIVGILVLFFVYCGFSNMIINQINKKNEEAEKSIEDTKTQISLIGNDIQSLQNRTNDYTSKINNLKQLNERIEENNRTKKAIPNLLNRLMYIMPSQVQLTSIQNTSTTHIEIQAQSSSYAELGYLAASIKTNGILTNVITTSGQKENNIVTIKIEGDLP